MVLALFLTACGSESTRTFELEQNGVITTMVYTKGDKVTKQSSNIIQYDEQVFLPKKSQELLPTCATHVQKINDNHDLKYRSKLLKR